MWSLIIPTKARERLVTGSTRCQTVAQDIFNRFGWRSCNRIGIVVLISFYASRLWPFLLLLSSSWAFFVFLWSRLGDFCWTFCLLIILAVCIVQMQTLGRTPLFEKWIIGAVVWLILLQCCFMVLLISSPPMFIYLQGRWLPDMLFFSSDDILYPGYMHQPREFF